MSHQQNFYHNSKKGFIPHYFSPKSSGGFTLIELLVVIAIIGILVSMALTSLSSARDKAKIARAQVDVKQIYMAIFMLEEDTAQWPGHKPPYKKDCGTTSVNEICNYPADNCPFGLNDCQSGLVCDDPVNPYPGWKGSYYIPEVPKDPWGNEYYFDTDYYINGNCYVVIGSCGPNGIANIKNDINGDTDDIIYIISAK